MIRVRPHHPTTLSVNRPSSRNSDIQLNLPHSRWSPVRRCRGRRCDRWHCQLGSRVRSCSFCYVETHHANHASFLAQVRCRILPRRLHPHHGMLPYWTPAHSPTSPILPANCDRSTLLARRLIGHGSRRPSLHGTPSPSSLSMTRAAARSCAPSPPFSQPHSILPSAYDC